MKKIISFLLVVLIALTSFAIPAMAVTEEHIPHHKSFQSACDTIRYYILQWKHPDNITAFDFYFKVTYETETYNPDTIYSDLHREIFKHTGDYYKGDSLKANLNGIGLDASADWDAAKGKYIVKVLVYGNYVLDRAKVQQLNMWVEKNSMWLATKKYKTGTSDYGKALGVYKWIIKNCKHSYGFDDVPGCINSHTTAWGVKYKKGICHGFAHLYYMMAVRCGLQCRMMDNVQHAYCVVKIDGKWYIVDPTIGRLGSPKKYFLIGHKNYKYDENYRDDYCGYLIHKEGESGSSTYESINGKTHQQKMILSAKNYKKGYK